MKKLVTSFLSLCLALATAAPAFAYDYSIPAPDGPAYANATSVETVYTPDGGTAKNEDVSKNAAYIPPVFGSRSAYTPNAAPRLTPDLAPETRAAAGAAIGGEAVAPPAYGAADEVWAASASGGTVTVSGTRPYSEAKHTEATQDLYYSGGHLGTLKIPAIGVNVKVYQGTDSSALAKGAGHFEETSVWDGNVAIAGHNRGANCYFGELHTLAIGDRITYTTKLGTRTYAVTSVAKVNETDRSGLADTPDNTLTLYTCVRDQRAYRWRVTAAEVG